jgi:hypothetical protein
MQKVATDGGPIQHYGSSRSDDVKQKPWLPVVALLSLNNSLIEPALNAGRTAEG